jgi:hypothetical protein
MLRIESILMLVLAGPRWTVSSWQQGLSTLETPKTALDQRLSLPHERRTAPSAAASGLFHASPSKQ